MRCPADRIRGGNWLADCLAILDWVKVSVRVRFRGLGLNEASIFEANQCISFHVAAAIDQ
jgi:hypothetical protein